MSRRICICCGEPMDEKGNALSRNPNICSSCSSLADATMDAGLADSTGASEVLPPLADSSANAKIAASQPTARPKRARPRA